MCKLNAKLRVKFASVNAPLIRRNIVHDIALNIANVNTA